MKPNISEDAWIGLFNRAGVTTLTHIEAMFGLLGLECDTLQGVSGSRSFTVHVSIRDDDDDRTEEQAAIDYHHSIDSHALMLLEKYKVSPHLALAFTHLGYAIWLKSNGWEMPDVAEREEHLFTHPTHGIHNFTGAMAHSFMEQQ